MKCFGFCGTRFDHKSAEQKRSSGERPRGGSSPPLSNKRWHADKCLSGDDRRKERESILVCLDIVERGKPKTQTEFVKRELERQQ